MKKSLALCGVLLTLSGCGYNTIQQQDETVKSAWSEVLNQYQRRADLVPQLVATVKGYAKHEQSVFVDVANARSKASSISANLQNLPDAKQLQDFSQAQGELTSALNRLSVVVERYPQLKANENFSNLQTQLEGTENRITHARRQYIESVRTYNTTLRQFPVNLTAMIFHYKTQPNFSVDNAQVISKAPKVEF